MKLSFLIIHHVSKMNKQLNIKVEFLFETCSSFLAYFLCMNVVFFYISAVSNEVTQKSWLNGVNCFAISELQISAVHQQSQFALKDTLLYKPQLNSITYRKQLVYESRLRGINPKAARAGWKLQFCKYPCV